MKKISTKDAVTMFAAGAILDLFEKQVYELHPGGVESLKAFENIKPEQFPCAAEFESQGKEIIARLIDDILKDLSELAKKYAE